MIPTTAIWKQQGKSSRNMSMMRNEVTLSQTNQSNVCNICYFEVAINGIKLFFKIWDKGGRFGGAVGAFRGPFSHPFPCPHQCKSHTAIPSTTTRAHISTLFSIDCNCSACRDLDSAPTAWVMYQVMTPTTNFLMQEHKVPSLLLR